MLSIPLILAGLALVVPQAQGFKASDIPHKCLGVCAPYSNAQSLCIYGLDNSATRVACLCKDSYLQHLVRCLSCEADPSVPLPSGYTRPTKESIEELTDIMVDLCYDLGLIVHHPYIDVPEPTKCTTKPTQTSSTSTSTSGSAAPTPTVKSGDDDDDDQTPLKPTGVPPKPTGTTTATTTTATTTSTSSAKATTTSTPSTKPTSTPAAAKPTGEVTSNASVNTPEDKSKANDLATKTQQNQDGLEDDDDELIANVTNALKEGKKKTGSAGRSASVGYTRYALAAAAIIVLSL